MPLTQPVKRKPLHKRQIVCEGFIREDGLWDIEAHLHDSKAYEFANQDRGGSIKAGEALHDLHIRLTIDDDLLIHQAQSSSDWTPYIYCQQAGKNIPSLAGLKIGPGWMRQVQQRAGGREGCTHLTELLKVIATTAYQTMSYKRQHNPDADSRPRYLDTCMSYASDSPVILRDWPQFYTGKK